MTSEYTHCTKNKSINHCNEIIGLQKRQHADLFFSQPEGHLVPTAGGGETLTEEFVLSISNYTLNASVIKSKMDAVREI